MTNTNVAVIDLHKGGTKYRIGTRAKLQAEGFVFTQVGENVDEFTRDGVTAQFFHGKDNVMTRAEIKDGKGPNVEIKEGRYKLERAIARLVTGDEAEHKPWYMTSAELKALPPAGKGDALILSAAQIAERQTSVETGKEDVPSAAVSPEAKPVPKPAPRRKAKTAAPKAG